MSAQIRRPGLALAFALAGALSFWLPDLLVHLVAGWRFDWQHVIIITFGLPIVFLATYLRLRVPAARRGYRSLAAAMVLEVWSLGAVFMMIAYGGWVRDPATLFLLLLAPLSTWVMATYDGSLGALVVVPLAHS